MKVKSWYRKIKKKLFLLIRNILKKKGMDFICLKDDPVNRRIDLFNDRGIDLVIDVGANIGQYAMKLRDLGYKGRILSFEPLPFEFIKLSENAKNDKDWQVVNIALGEFDGESDINVANLSVRSSMLNMSDDRFRLAPNIGKGEYVGRERVLVRKLDSIYDEYVKTGEKVLLKLDVQGYEKNILDGSEMSFNKLIGLQIELSLVRLYDDETIFVDMINFLGKKGFSLQSIEPGFYNPKTSRMLQFDGIFFRDK